MDSALPQLQRFPKQRRQCMSRNGYGARGNRRYTSLVVNAQNRWLCPECPVIQEDAGHYWEVLHYFSWDCFDEPEDEAETQILSNIKMTFTKFEERDKRGIWKGNEYEQIVNGEAVSYYSNLPFSWTCRNTATFDQGRVTIGKPCGFSRVEYSPSKVLTHLQYPSLENHEKLVLLSTGTRLCHSSDRYANSHWICMKCLVRSQDLMANWTDIRRCRAAIRSLDSGYQQYLVLGAYFGDPRSETYFYVNSFYNGGFTCRNKKYGNGPRNSDLECGYEFGTILEYTKDPAQYGCLVSYPAGTSPLGISPTATASMIPRLQQIPGSVSEESELNFEGSAEAVAEVPAPENWDRAESSFTTPGDHEKMVPVASGTSGLGKRRLSQTSLNGLLDGGEEDIMMGLPNCGGAEMEWPFCPLVDPASPQTFEAAAEVLGSVPPGE